MQLRTEQDISVYILMFCMIKHFPGESRNYYLSVSVIYVYVDSTKLALNWSENEDRFPMHTNLGLHFKLSFSLNRLGCAAIRDELV